MMAVGGQGTDWLFVQGSQEQPMSEQTSCCLLLCNLSREVLSSLLLKQNVTLILSR